MLRRRPQLLWQICLSNLVILVPALFVVAWLGYQETRVQYLQVSREGLTLHAQVVARLLQDPGLREAPEKIQALVDHLAKHSPMRYTVVSLDGRVIADSSGDPSLMPNHGSRPEIQSALGGRQGEDTRASLTVGKELMYHAVPVAARGEVVAVVRTSMAIKQISDTLASQLFRIAIAVLLVTLFAALASFLLASRLVKPLREMQEGAARFADGDLRYRLEVPTAKEPGALAEAMNEMAAQLDERIRLVTQQRNQQEAVLASMVEAVLVVDERARLIQANQAAVRLFGLDPEAALGASLEVGVRHGELQRFFQRILLSTSPQEAELVLERDPPLHLRAVGTRLRGTTGKSKGAMVVLHDVTQLKRLEVVRRDFVANVSHELKTPITSIQGFVETLRDGALEDPEDARRFLEIIARHTVRLGAITEDLLTLSNIEIEGGAGQIPLELAPVGPVLRAAMQLCEGKAANRGIRLVLAEERDVEAPINAPLLEQTIVNLVDNAIKYSPDGGDVTLSARRDRHQVVIEVVDHGRGIAPEHQPRIFERFYRVDRARSRALGGTGLGLAIVKHVIAAHRGSIGLESKVGEGSTFRIRLPAEGVALSRGR